MLHACFRWLVLVGLRISLFFTAPFRCGAKTGNFGEELPEPLSPGSTALNFETIGQESKEVKTQKFLEMPPF